jgi:pimeloyl-ACP methyl ester carboxylesterase
MKIKESSMYYKEYGSGEPLLLIAGLASDSQSWLPIVNRLSKHFRVIIFDNRGVGRSDSNNDGITIEIMTNDCVRLINHLGYSKVNILGHSMGGIIAMDMAINFPDMVDKLIVEASAPQLNNRNIELFNDWVNYLNEGMKKELWFKNIFYWIFSPVFFNNIHVLNQAIELSVNYPYPQSDTSFKNQVLAITTFSCLSKVKKIKSPTLIVFGELDLLFPPLETETLFKDIVHKSISVVPKAAHSVHIDNPEYFIETVLNFLSGS